MKLESEHNYPDFYNDKMPTRDKPVQSARHTMPEHRKHNKHKHWLAGDYRKF